MKAVTNHLSLNRLSIQQRLPLLICGLLLLVIVIYGYANYYSLRKATLSIGKERLNTLTSQVNQTYQQLALFLVKTSDATAAQSAVIQCIKSNGKEFTNETMGLLDKLNRDSTWVLAQLLNQNLQPVLRSNMSTVDLKIDLKEVLSAANVKPNLGSVGKLYRVKSLVYFPVISAVSDAGKVIGYVIAWKSLLGTPKQVAQFSQFVGGGASFYLGNADSTLWTNLIKPLPGAPFKIKAINELVEFADEDGKHMMASPQFIPNTKWLVAVAFSEQELLSGVMKFVNLIIIIGIAITAMGILTAWLMSRRITTPLNQLTAAATTISQGNYNISVPAHISGNDELGKLANAFNIMVAQVAQMHDDLENKVNERTSQLQTVNRELEAFSYSVSHDLRTPLRAVNGYAVMLKEDYEAELDSEANRILRNIIINAKMMGQLIDDLLAFSRLGKKELVRTTVDIHQLATAVVNELLQHEPENKCHISIGLLPPAEADFGMIKQVLTNLLSNAVKYSSKKENPEIEIGFYKESARTVYFIKDNGVGFDMAYADKLFGVFQRLHSQEEFEGTGVGLALVKRIIDKHNGEIWAEGHENQGATFYFSLPGI